MQEVAASMSLQSVAVLLSYKETPIANAQLHRLNRLPSTPKSFGPLPRCTRRRLLVANEHHSNGPNGQEPTKEIRLDKQDLMAIEFGRLLGESRDKTISKVLSRKINPGSTYVDLEKQAKAGKELINKADLAVKADQPRGPSRNGSMLGTAEPRLASPPLRKHGPHFNMPKIGGSAGTQETSDDSLLRRPSSNQRSKAVSHTTSSTSLATYNVEGAKSQHMAAMEQGIADLDRLRRPSMEDNDSMEASKLEFQRLLDKSSDTSTANLASLPRREAITKNETTVENSFRSMDAAAALPTLASRPSRHRGSIGTFVQPSQIRDKATWSSIKSPANDASDKPLLRKPGVEASCDAMLSSVQAKDDIQVTQVDEPIMPPKTKSQPDLDEASVMPDLATPPSRHRGSIGTFVQPNTAKMRGIQPHIEHVDNSIDESLLRKPSLIEKASASTVSTLPTEASMEPLLKNEQTQLKDKSPDVNLLPRPLMESHNTQIDDNRCYQLEGMEQDVGEKTSQIISQSERQLAQDDQTSDNTLSDYENRMQVTDGSNISNEVLVSEPRHHSQPVLKAESSAQFQGQSAEQRTLEGEVVLNKVGNGPFSVAKSGGLQDKTSGLESEDLAVLKKPIRVSYLESRKGPASESTDALDPLQGRVVSPDIIQQASVGDLDKNKEAKKVHEVEESVESPIRCNESIGTHNAVSMCTKHEASSGDQQRDQMVQEELTGMPGTEQINVLNDETSNASADRKTGNDSVLLQSMDMLRRPPQIAHADSLIRHSEHIDLQSSNPKLHQAKEEEEKDWAQAEAALKAKKQVEVKLIGSNSAGLFVSFGCLVGFLPSFELSTRRGIVDFGSWAQQKGYDLNQKRPVNGVHGGGQSGVIQDVEELRDKYKEDISKLMSSLVGEKTKVIVKLLDKDRRKIRVSEKEADADCREHLQKKAYLMAELKLGEVVTCQVKSITPIGVFVEVDGVPALIHHSEVSWNMKVDPASLLSIGEMIKAKVCRLDRTLQRINLSLKQMQPDPLKRTLESVVGDIDTDNPMCEVESSKIMEMDWPELGDLMKKLKQTENISRVTRGRCLYSAAFAPTFQVLISTPQNNGYKLLARFENKIQEILVETTLDQDKMKEQIRLCTFSEA